MYGLAAGIERFPHDDPMPWMAPILVVLHTSGCFAGLLLLTKIPFPLWWVRCLVHLIWLPMMLWFVTACIDAHHYPDYVTDSGNYLQIAMWFLLPLALYVMQLYLVERAMRLATSLNDPLTSC